MSIKMKLFLGNLIIAILTLGILTYYISEIARSTILNSEKEDVGYSVSQLSQNIDNLLYSYEQIVDSLYVNTELQNSLMADYHSFEEVQAAYFQYYVPYANWMKASREILRLAIYTNNTTFQFGDVKLLSDEEFDSSWYQSLQLSHAALVKSWTMLESEAQLHRGVIRLAQKVQTGSDQKEMYVTLDLEDRLLRNLVSKENKNERFLIVLPDGRVAVDTYKPYDYHLTISEYPFYDRIRDPLVYSDTYDDADDHYLLTSYTLTTRKSVQGLKVVKLTPISELTSSIQHIESLALKLLILAVLASGIIIFLLTRQLTKRLTALARHMKGMNMDNLHSFIELKGSDEVSQLGRIFNNMIDRMDKLIKRMYHYELTRKELELQARESELYALQAQINPHYLFNTLNAIRGSLLSIHDKKHATIIKLLAQSFRNVLGKNENIVTLLEEQQSVETFLQIQKFRFGERLDYSIDIPCRLQAVKLPRLSLQTLVENIIIHVLDHSKAATSIHISARSGKDGECVVSVLDNGPGIPERDRLRLIERMNRPVSNPDSKQIGLRNIHQRIQKTFGNEYGMDIKSGKLMGTEMILRLPLGEE